MSAKATGENLAAMTLVCRDWQPPEKLKKELKMEEE
jgi:hypothetical protein